MDRPRARHGVAGHVPRRQPANRQGQFLPAALVVLDQLREVDGLVGLVVRSLVSHSHVPRASQPGSPLTWTVPAFCAGGSARRESSEAINAVNPNTIVNTNSPVQ